MKERRGNSDGARFRSPTTLQDPEHDDTRTRCPQRRNHTISHIVKRLVDSTSSCSRVRKPRHAVAQAMNRVKFPCAIPGAHSRRRRPTRLPRASHA